MVGRERPRAPPLTAGNGAPAGAPYDKGAVHSPVPADGARLYVTIRNLAQVAKRKKPLPPDGKADATPCQLYQLEEHVEYRCTRCRKDGIFDDVLAADETSGMMMCARCYARAIRPKQYRPTRMVPFPSLLAWLHYKPAAAQSSVSEDVMNRPAEAVAPSGSRALGVESALSAPKSAADLVDTPLNPEGGRLDAASRLAIEASSNDAAREALNVGGSHPCPRVFGKCSHGATCFFLRARRMLSLGFLMGIVPAASTEEKAAALAGGSEQAQYLSLKAGASGASGGIGDETQESVFDLPPASDPAPERTWENREAWALWVERRQRSSNQAEWQLWNQESTLKFVDAVVPPPSAPEVLPDDEDAAAAEEKPKGVAALRGVLAKLRKK